MKKLFTGLFTSLLVCIMVLTVVSADDLSASKTLTSTTYGTSVLKMTATASCSIVNDPDDFEWKTTQKDKLTQGSGYTIITSKKQWTESSTSANKKTVFNWEYKAYQLPTGSSGSMTYYGNGTGRATFTYNISTKQLSVQ